VRLWDTTDWREIAAPEEAVKDLKDCALSPDGRTLVVVANDRSVAWWDLPSGQRLSRFENQFERDDACVVFSPDGRVIAVSETKGVIRLWDSAARREIAKIHGNLRTVLGLAFSPDGRRLLSSGAQDEDAVRLLDLGSQRYVAGLPAVVGQYPSVSMSPDGNTLVAIGYAGTAVFWHAPSWAEIEAVEQGPEK
jgi:WD40 repeat protein